MCNVLEDGDDERLCRYLTEAPEAKRCHPTPDHILPIFVAAGAGKGSQCSVIDDSYIYGVFSMASMLWQ